jgi:menaquinone-dependent protoporphyrinogen oxidase
VVETGSILVTYATKYGSTQQVAEAVAETLRGRGEDAECRPVRDVRKAIGHRDLVVLGGAIYRGRWHRDAHRFLKRHRKELLAVPVAVFGMGPRTEEGWERSRAQLDRDLAKHDWLSPVAVTVFGGADPPGREGKPHRDLRDWDVIRGWTDALV